MPPPETVVEKQPSDGRLNAEADSFVSSIQESTTTESANSRTEGSDLISDPSTTDKQVLTTPHKSATEQTVCGRAVSSPPPLKTDGRYRCCFCERIISYQDGVYLCKVCGALDCSCDDNFDYFHQHSGFDCTDMWLGEERLDFFIKMFDVKP